MLYRNQELLNRYLSGRRLGVRTRENYRAALTSFTKLVGVPLEKAGRHEFEEWFRRASQLGLSASTIHIYASRLKKLVVYDNCCKGFSRREADVRAADIMEAVPMVDLRREIKLCEVNPDTVITFEEFKALMMEASHTRVKAFLTVLLESACRKGEILGLRVRDVVVYDRHMELRVKGKTGFRVAPLVHSVRYLDAWLEAHPDPRPGAPLFATTFKGEVRRMEEHTPNRLLNDLCDRAGIRRIYPHMLRHTRLTELARKGLGEYQLKSFAGWTPDSRMAARYIHLSGRSHVDAILKASGVEPQEAETR